MNVPEIDKQLYQSTAEMICRYMEDKHDLHLGQFEAEFFLDEILQAVSPALYNRGLDEAIKTVRSISERLEEELDMRKVL